MPEKGQKTRNKGRNAPVRVGCQVAIVYAVINGYLDSVPVKNVHEYEDNLYARLENQHADWLKRIEDGYFDDSDIEALKSILQEMKV